MEIIPLYAIIAALTGPLPGTSLLLLGVEVTMVIHLSKKHGCDLNIKEIGAAITAILAVAQLLKILVIELFFFLPVIGWFAQPLVAVTFVVILGMLANWYFTGRKASLQATVAPSSLSSER